MSNPNNPSDNTTDSKKKNENIPTVVGVFLIIILVSTFVYLFLKFQKSDIVEKTPGAQVAAPVSISPAAIPASTAPQTGIIPPGDTAPVIPPDTSASINFDYEAGQLDKQINSANPNDFNKADLSDSQVGM